MFSVSGKGEKKNPKIHLIFHINIFSAASSHAASHTRTRAATHSKMMLSPLPRRTTPGVKNGVLSAKASAYMQPGMESPSARAPLSPMSSSRLNSPLQRCGQPSILGLKSVGKGSAKKVNRTNLKNKENASSGALARNAATSMFLAAEPDCAFGTSPSKTRTPSPAESGVATALSARQAACSHECLQDLFQLLLRDSHRNWEDRLHACQSLTRYLSNPDAKCSNQDAVLLGKCCLHQLSDKRPKIVAAAVDLTRVCMSHIQLVNEVVVKTLPSLLAFSVSSKTSFSAPAKEALFDIASLLTLSSNDAMMKTMKNVFVSSQNPKIRSQILKMFMNTLKESASCLPTGHYTPLIDGVIIHSLLDKSIDVRTEGRLLFSLYVKHCPTQGAALFHSSKMKLSLQKQLRRVCPQAVEACMSITYMGQDHITHSKIWDTGREKNKADTKSHTIGGFENRTKENTVANNQDAKIVTTITTVTTTTTTVTTPPRQGSKARTQISGERDEIQVGSRLKSLLEWKTRSDNEKKYKRLLKSPNLKSQRTEYLQKSVERRRMQMMSPTMRRYLPAHKRKVAASKTSLKEKLKSKGSLKKRKRMDPLSPITSVINSLATPKHGSNETSLDKQQRQENTEFESLRSNTLKKFTAFLKERAEKRESRHVQDQRANMKKNNLPDFYENTLSKLELFFTRPKPKPNMRRIPDKSLESCHKASAVLTPLFDLHGLVLEPPTPTKNSTFNMIQSSLENEPSTSALVPLHHLNIIPRSHTQDGIQVLKQEINSAILKEDVLAKLGAFLKFRKQVKDTKQKEDERLGTDMNVIAKLQSFLVEMKEKRKQKKHECNRMQCKIICNNIKRTASSLTPVRPPTPRVAAAALKIQLKKRRMLQKHNKKHSSIKDIPIFETIKKINAVDHFRGKSGILKSKFMLWKPIFVVALTVVLAAFASYQMVSTSMHFRVEKGEARGEHDVASMKENDLDDTKTIFQPSPPANYGNCFPVITTEEYVQEQRQLCYIEESFEFVYWIPTPLVSTDADEKFPQEEVERDSLNREDVEPWTSDAEKNDIDMKLISPELSPEVNREVNSEPNSDELPVITAEPIIEIEVGRNDVKTGVDNLIYHENDICSLAHDFNAHPGESRANGIGQNTTANYQSHNSMMPAFANIASFPLATIILFSAILVNRFFLFMSPLFSWSSMVTRGHALQKFTTPQGKQTDPTHEYSYSDSGAYEESDFNSESSFSPSSSAAHNDANMFVDRPALDGIGQAIPLSSTGPSIWVDLPMGSDSLEGTAEGYGIANSEIQTNASAETNLGSFTGLEVRKTRKGTTKVTPVRRSRRVKKRTPLPRSAARAVESNRNGLVIEHHIARAIAQSVAEGQINFNQTIPENHATTEEGVHTESTEGNGAEEGQGQPKLRRSRRIARRKSN